MSDLQQCIECVECDHRDINIPLRHRSSGQEVIYNEITHKIKLFALSYKKKSEHAFLCVFTNF